MGGVDYPVNHLGKIGDRGKSLQSRLSAEFLAIWNKQQIDYDLRSILGWASVGLPGVGFLFVHTQ